MKQTISYLVEAGRASCAGCGTDLGAAGVQDALIVTDLHPDNPGTVLNLYFCRDREEDGKKVRGCAIRLMSRRNLDHFHKTREKVAKSRPERARGG